MKLYELTKLPDSKRARLQRAKSIGFDITRVWHPERTDFPVIGNWYVPIGGEGTDYSNEIEEGAIIPVFLRYRKPFVIPKRLDMEDTLPLNKLFRDVNAVNRTTLTPQHFKLTGNMAKVKDVFGMNEQVLRVLIKMGFDAIVARYDGQFGIGMFHLSNVRSIRARFDPSKQHLGRIFESRVDI